MLDIGSRIITLRKNANLSQSELAKKVEVSRTIIGNYERNENTPSIDILLKIAKTFDVTIDFLVGEGSLSTYDKNVLKRIEKLSQLNSEEKDKIFMVIDALIRDFNAKKAYS